MLRRRLRRTVRCRYERDRSRRLEVFIGDGQTCIAFADGTWVRLAPLEVGRLRALLRDAVLELGAAR